MKLYSGRRLALALGALIMAGTLPGAALAQPKGPGPGKEAAQERREERKEAREEKKDAAKEAREERKEEAKEAREAGKDARQAWREQRRAARRAFLDKWGPIHKQPAVRAELELHARRVARLNAMKAVAEAEKKDKLVTKCEELLKRENARHEKRMEALKKAEGKDEAKGSSTAEPKGAAK